MNNYVLVLGLILFSNTFCAQTTKKVTYPTDEIHRTFENTTITGKVLNFEKHKDNKTLVFVFTSLFELKENFVAVIDKDGLFHIDIPIFYTQDFLLDYGNYSTHLIRPGDSLYFEIDADIFLNPKDKYPNGKYFSRVTGGVLIQENKQITEFLENRPENLSESEIKNKSPEEYTIYIAETEKKYRAIATVFKKHNQTSKLFNLWLDDLLKYESLDQLMRYRWLRPRTIKVEGEPFQLPKSYFSFLENYDMNDSKMITRKHASFLYEIADYLTPEENPIKAIEENTIGFTKDVAITNLYIMILKANFLKEFEAIYDSTKISNPHFLKIIENQHAELKLFMNKQDVSKANLVDIDNEITKNLVHTIVNKYKGKVVYIDFWATWCAPCIKEMPQSKILQDYFKGKDVVFLFLANRSSETTWKAMIFNKKLTGEHLLLTNDQYNVLASEFGISGIPHYALIDKKGNIASKKAHSPSTEDEIIKSIEELLE